MLRTLAEIRFAMGDREPALELFGRAVLIYRELGSWIEEDRALDLQADALVMAGRKADAVAALERVMALRELMGGMGLAEVRDRLESLR
ncbi:tetratricopeptide repeat protein [Streptomyces bacillaris]|uniref:tetratricopeptide repeat protein n=1 Tax=Streptomyces bacillaris TaxID=68179 RepID=UPI003460A6B9